MKFDRFPSPECPAPAGRGNLGTIQVAGPPLREHANRGTAVPIPSRSEQRSLRLRGSLPCVVPRFGCFPDLDVPSFWVFPDCSLDLGFPSILVFPRFEWSLDLRGPLISVVPRFECSPDLDGPDVMVPEFGWSLDLDGP